MLIQCGLRAELHGKEEEHESEEAPQTDKQIGRDEIWIKPLVSKVNP